MTSNKEIAETFKIAKEIHASGKTAFICHAIYQVYDTSHISVDARDICIRLISDRLGGSSIVDWWLLKNGGDYRQLTPEAMFQYRQEWLDKLIDEFSIDGWYSQCET